MKIAASLALFVCLLCGAVSIASAADSAKSPNTHKSQRPASKPTLVFNRQLKSTSFSFGEDDTSVPAFTYTPIDNVLKFTCPAATCTVTAEVHAQFGGNSTTDDSSALCAELDGNFMPPPGGGNGCPYTGLVRSDGGYAENSFTFTQNGVTRSAHTLQSLVFTNEDTILANYSVVYRLYTP